MDIWKGESTMRKLENKKIILWGTGSVSNKIYTNILMRDLTVKIECFIDNDYSKAGGSIFNIPIYHADEILKLKTKQHIIVVCSSYEDEISKQLTDLGFKKSIDFILYHEFYEILEYLVAIEQIAFYDELKVIVGANQTSQKGWIATNRNYLDLLVEDDWIDLFGERKIHSIVGEHVWEHLTYADGVIAASNCYKYLKKGGKLRIAIPDGNHPNPHYINWVKVNGCGDAADDHKELYTHQTLKRMLKEAGFKQIEKLEYFDDEGNFHAKEWKIEDGFIKRSMKNDPRNWRGNIVYSSLIIDAIK